MYIRKNREHLLDERDNRTRAHDAPLFKIEIPTNQAYKRSVEYAGSKQWNGLTVDIRSARDIVASSIVAPSNCAC